MSQRERRKDKENEFVTEPTCFLFFVLVSFSFDAKWMPSPLAELPVGACLSAGCVGLKSNDWDLESSVVFHCAIHSERLRSSYSFFFSF